MSVVIEARELSGIHGPIAAIALALFLAASCSGDDRGFRSEVAEGTDDREMFNDEDNGVRAMVADCFVTESPTEGRRYRTTVEVVNESKTARTITVTIRADLGRGGVSEAFEVPSGATDAWSVASDEETSDPVGDVECADYITGVELTVEP